MSEALAPALGDRVRRSGMGSHEATVGKTDVWLTPPAVLSALGRFDLDPCAPAVRPWDTAAEHYTESDDGLSLPWRGRVWLNPPYGAGVGRWMRRLSEHGRGTAIIFARTETAAFFDTVWRSPTASALLFLEGRLHFHRADGSRASMNAGAPSVLVAYGPDDAAILAGCGLAGHFVRLGNV